MFIFFLARFIAPEQLGLYGLFTATVGYSLYLLGFDFYTYTTREILKIDRSGWGGMLKSQVALSMLLYAVFLPLLSLLFFTDVLPFDLAAWFFVILVLEHINQELSRLLVAISEQLLASIGLFLRQGAWAIGVVVLMLADSSTRTLHYVFGAWTLAGVLTVVLSLHWLGRIRMGGWQSKIDWAWIGKGLKVCIPLLGATLALRGLFTLDRYWLQELGGLEVVGAYVLFFGISGTLMAFLDAGVFAYSYPRLIRAAHGKDPLDFRIGVRKLFSHTCYVSIGFSMVSLLLLSPLLQWIGKPWYLEQKALYPWLLLAMVVNAIGMVPHYALYAMGKDRPIIVSHVASIVVFVAVTWLFGSVLPVLAVPIGLCVAFLFVLAWKTLAYFKLTPGSYRAL